MLKRMTSFILAIVMVLGVMQIGGVQASQNQTNFTDVSTNHWAASSISAAVKAGYVNGYTDGTFRPDNFVTREEFISMTTRAFEFDLSEYKHALWSMPSLMSAVENGWIEADEYTRSEHASIPDGVQPRGTLAAPMQLNGDTVTVYATTANYPMSRVEMARIAILATGATDTIEMSTDYINNDQVMYAAVSNGIIAGMGNGELAPNGTTTRAQAVAIIQRMLSLNAGETLPIDDEALVNAEKSLNVEYDPWGRAIRTTNLPSNADLFPYILEEIPNEMYEMAFADFANLGVETPKLIADEKRYTKDDIDKIFARVENGMNMKLNVDYKTINPEAWGKKLETYQSGGPLIQDYINTQYANWVVENKIQIEGSISVEPSIVYQNQLGRYVRAHVKFRINNFEKYNDDLFQDTYFSSQHYNLEPNVWYEGYADLRFSTNSTGDIGNTAALSTNASLFYRSQFNGVEYNP